MNKVRRNNVNSTGIYRLSNIPYNDVFVVFPCINCKKILYYNIGGQLLTPEYAYNNVSFTCGNCNQVHAKNANLPFDNWENEYKDAQNNPTQKFWQGFFRNITEYTSSYWKQCNSCGSILPFSHFSKHSGWGPLERQIECRSCKGAINADLNSKRTKEQLHESSIRRRIADLFVLGDNEKIDIEDLFNRFEHKCFKTGKPLNINDRDSWEIDHIMPSLYLWPLTFNNAALLSKEANNSKKAKWPSEFYTNGELINLSKITGANLNLLSNITPVININIDVNKGIERYLNVRENSNLRKRITELVKIILDYNLEDKVSLENKKILGIGDH